MALKYTIQEIFGDDWEESPESLAYRYILDFGDAVYDRMKELGMSYREVAEKAGLKPSNLSAVVSGNSNPTVKTMERIAMALGCELAAPELQARKSVSVSAPAVSFFLTDFDRESVSNAEPSCPVASSVSSSDTVRPRSWVASDERTVAA